MFDFDVRFDVDVQFRLFLISTPMSIPAFRFEDSFFDKAQHRELCILHIIAAFIFGILLGFDYASGRGKVGIGGVGCKKINAVNFAFKPRGQ